MVGLDEGAGQRPVPGRTIIGHMVGQGPAVRVVRDGWAVFDFVFSSRLSYLPFLMPHLGRRLDILKYCGLGRYNPMVVVSYYRRRALSVLVNRLVGLSLLRNSVTHLLSCDFLMTVFAIVKLRMKKTH